MRDRRYEIFDVFTDRPLAGNPLAIVHDCDGLDSDGMQAIAREFNLSETVFVEPAANANHTAKIRIFTPNFEMPFAGHPTVGTAVSLALGRGLGEGAGDTMILVLEEKIGDVRCVVTRNGGGVFAEFDLPQLSSPIEISASAETVGAALGLGPHEIGFENHRVAAFSAGVPYITVPVRGLDVAAKARLDSRAWKEIAPDRGNGVPASAYVYCRETVMHDSAFHARMFTGGQQSYEDPATGSALAAFSGAVLAFDQPTDGAWQGWVEQGIEMKRTSRLRLEIDVEGGAASGARIGGNAVRVATGTLTA
ncbi:MAG: PhzF family phenazine biosynthesis protein [Rhizobiaceae bacterium]|nr:PhzF family phenazine biosynthesis protein [Rhizobiaceae bacterium]